MDHFPNFRGEKSTNTWVATTQYHVGRNVLQLDETTASSSALQSTELPYPTLEKKKTSSKVPWEKICYFPGG